MLNLLNKKRKLLGNKGFSLVELIIVIAIMAVLIAVLAPQYLKYVENSRKAADDATATEILNAVKVAITKDTVYAAIVDNETVTWSASAAAPALADSGTGTPIGTELASVITSVPAGKSQTYKGQNYVITVDVDTTNFTASATGQWVTP